MKIVGRSLNKPPLKIGEIRPLTRDDLSEIIGKKRQAQTVQYLRDSHHMVARLVAAGVRPNSEIARRTGFAASRISNLIIDPAFQELVASYRGDVDAAFIRSQDDFFETATSNMLKAERQIAEKLDKADEEGELLPVRDLLAISRDAADRFGYGKKTTNLNVNVDFASKLEQAIARTKAVSSPTISPTDGAEPSLALVSRRL